jgi:GntR family transcriptional regulator, rspAB operon transcriptional repressor
MTMADQNSSTARGANGLTVDMWLSEALIREVIVNRHPPGFALREQDIADRFKVSRPSVREALRLMAHAGFVEIQPWRGARVVAMAFDQFLDILALLEDIYARCATLAATRLPDITIDSLANDLETAALTRTTATREELYRFSFRFGAAIGDGAQSAVANRMLQQVGRIALWQQRLLLPGTIESEGRSLDVHRLLVAALRARHPALAAEAARAIVQITRQSLLAANAEDLQQIV